MNILAIMILWTWSLTPLWVNIVGTCIFGIRILCDTIKAILER